MDISLSLCVANAKHLTQKRKKTHTLKIPIQVSGSHVE